MSPAIKRNVQLDVIKGGLVLVMLVYHCISVSSFASLRVVLNHIQFIHTAFLVMFGFLCGYHYYPSARIEPVKIRKKLLTRAIKILIIFLGGNVFFHLLGFGQPGMARLQAIPIAQRMMEILLKVPGDILAFEILYLIAVFMFVAAFIISFPFTKLITCALILLPMVASNKLIYYNAFGCTGMLIGILVQERRLDGIARRFDRLLWLFPILLAIRHVSIPDWESIIPFQSGRMMFILLETLLWFYSFLWAARLLSRPWLNEQVVLFGAYTLPAYIMQMVLARVTYVILNRAGFTNFSYCIFCVVIVMISTGVVVNGMDYLRRNWPVANRAYRLLFS